MQIRRRGHFRTGCKTPGQNHRRMEARTTQGLNPRLNETFFSHIDVLGLIRHKSSGKFVWPEQLMTIRR